MTDAPMPVRPGFHLVEPSPWPIIAAGFALTTAIGLVLFMHGVGVGRLVLALGIAGVLFTMAGWWRDVVLEAQHGYQNAIVRHGLTIGMLLFIASEVMFFVAWFWAFFASSLGAGDPQVYGRLDFTGGMWPPKGTEVLDPLRLPLMNTFVLVTSSFAVNVAHDDLRQGDRQGFKNFLALGIGLGALFVITQAYEYIHAPFAFKNSIYGATFFMATGFHGAHVIIGVIFLTVCLARAWAGQFTPRQHLGFQFAAWYWHFVDVVWIFLFTCIYLWGSWGRRSKARSGAAEERMTEPLHDVEPGMVGRAEVSVTRELTVGAHVEGMPLVYATPMMIMLMEKASGAAVAGHLPPGWVSVGSEVNVRHLAPTPLGRTVVATARVVAVEGRSILFAVEAHDGERKIGEGVHRRGAVNLEAFARRLGG